MKYYWLTNIPKSLQYLKTQNNKTFTSTCFCLLFLNWFLLFSSFHLYSQIHMFFIPVYIFSGPPKWLSGKEFACHWKRQETQVWSLSQEDPLKDEMVIHSSILAGKITCTRSLVDYSPWGCKESDTTEHAWACNVRVFSTHLFNWNNTW